MPQRYLFGRFPRSLEHRPLVLRRVPVGTRSDSVAGGALELLTLPVRPEKELSERCRRILQTRRDLEPVVLSMLFERFSQLSREEILMIVGLPLQELRHTRAVQEILEEGRQEGHQMGRQEGLEAGRQQEAAALAIRQLVRRFGGMEEGSRERIAALPLPRLERLAEDLLDFAHPDDVKAWFAENGGD